MEPRIRYAQTADGVRRLTRDVDSTLPESGPGGGLPPCNGEFQ